MSRAILNTRTFLPGLVIVLTFLTGLNAVASEAAGLTVIRYPFHKKSINFKKAEAISEPLAPEVAVLGEKWVTRYPHDFLPGPLVRNQDHLFWAAKFQGSLVVPEDGDYVFRITADDYANLIIGGEILIRQYGERANQTKTSEPIRLSNDQPMPILVEYWNVLGPSFLHLEWKTPDSDEFVTIPAEAFRPEAAVSPFMVTRVRFFPAPGQASQMVGGTFSGSLTSPTNDFEPFVTIEETPNEGEWNVLDVPTPKAYRFVKYEAPADSHGAIAELGFYNRARKLEGEGFGTAGSRDDSGNTWQNALDGDTGTYYEGVDPDHQYVGIDLGPDSQLPQPDIRRMKTDSEAQVFVKITVPEGSFVRYTLPPAWGSQPDPTLLEGIMYTGPFSIAEDTTIIATAFDQWRAPSKRSVAEMTVAKIDLREGYASLHTGNSLMGGLSDFIPMIAASAGFEHPMDDIGAAGAPTDYIWKTEHLRQRVLDFLSEHKPGIYVPQPFSRNPKVESYWESVVYKEVLAHNPEAKLMIYMQWADDSHYKDEKPDRIRLEQKFETPDGEPWPVDLEDYVKPGEKVSDDPSLVGWRGKCIILSDPETWAESIENYMRSIEILYKVMDDQHPDQHVSVVPVGYALLKIYNSILAGEMPNVAPEVGHAFFFADGAHLNPSGQYISALTHFACMYQMDPAGKVSSAGSGLSPDQARRIQHLVWEAVQEYPYSSVNVD